MNHLPRLRGQRGSLVIQSLVVIGFIIAFLVMIANLVAWTYVKGAAHAAVDQAARAGARMPGVDGSGVCEDRVRQVLDNVLAGPAGAGAEVGCVDDGEVVTARVALRLQAWLPPLADTSFEATGLVRKERAP